MPKAEKVKLNVKERVVDSHCDLSLSELREVPVREIAAFKRVTHLDLSSNRLTSLGKNFTTLTRIVKLDLSKNQIRFLPEDFGQLENLRHLDLYDNRLEHIPLSFGKLKRLRYLDLKGNPLTPAWEKIVGRCLTNKDCHESAKYTVSVCANLKKDLIEKEKLAAPACATNAIAMAQSTSEAKTHAEGASTQQSSVNNSNNKKSNKKQKPKQQKKATNVTVNDNELTIKEVKVQQQKQSNSKNNTKRKASNGQQKKRFYNTSTALTSILTFLLLLAINIVIIYMIMFKNPEIADKLVEYIPHQYRDWILTKTEIFRLRVTDWISEFRTPPEEH